MIAKKKKNVRDKKNCEYIDDGLTLFKLAKIINYVILKINKRKK